tara:strand:- start:1201 stop:1527 length:327 start_codon:yes stop_codon:yes gene_type:complete
MIKPIDEALLGNLELSILVYMKFHDQVASKFSTEPEINDDFLPGLGTYEAYWGELENGVTFSVLTCVEEGCQPQEYFDIYTEKVENIDSILAELELPQKAIKWKRENS